MIKGIGTDIVEIQRVAQAVTRTPRFIDKVFAEEEKLLLQKINFKAESVAGKFAAKEAISKALGTGFRGFEPRDIVILKDELGRPVVRLDKGAKVRFGELGGIVIHLSISHCKEYAVAYATLEGRDTHEISD